MIILKSSNVLSSQHLNGHNNIISNLLTYKADNRKLEKYSNFHLLAFDRPSDSLLTAHFNNFLPQLIPQHFCLCQLPPEIASLVTQAMQIQKLSWICARNLPMKPTIASGNAGASSAKPNSKMLSTHSSMVYPLWNNTSYSSHFLLCTSKLSSILTDWFVANVQNQWYQQLFEWLLTQLVHRLSTATGKHPLICRTGEILSHFSGKYFWASIIFLLLSSTKKLQHPVFFNTYPAAALAPSKTTPRITPLILSSLLSSLLCVAASIFWCNTQVSPRSFKFCASPSEINCVKSFPPPTPISTALLSTLPSYLKSRKMAKSLKVPPSNSQTIQIFARFAGPSVLSNV